MIQRDSTAKIENPAIGPMTSPGSNSMPSRTCTIVAIVIRGISSASKISREKATMYRRNGAEGSSLRQGSRSAR